MRVAIVGGTGPFGIGLATRLQAAGNEVLIGSRDRDRASAAAAPLGASGATNDEVVRSVDLIVLATKADAAVATARELRDAVGSTPVLSVASELRFTPEGVLPALDLMSIAERIQSELDAPVVAGLHSLAASNLGAATPPDEDALVCGDDPAAKAMALALAEQVTSGRALDAGPLASARVLEGLTAVIVNLNRRYGAHAGIRVTGIP